MQTCIGYMCVDSPAKVGSELNYAQNSIVKLWEGITLSATSGAKTHQWFAQLRILSAYFCILHY